MPDADPPFVFPDASLYHGPDEVAGYLGPLTERHPFASRQLAQEDTLEVGQLRISRRLALWFSVGKRH